MTLDRLLPLGCLGATLFVEAPASHAQAPRETGRPFITHYTPTDYGAHPQNSAIVQDDRGVMYFGNTGGVLEYDGVSWRLIPLPNKSRVAGLDKDAEGRIWVSGHGEIGYLAPDSLGQLGFVSLTAHIPEAERDFGIAWTTHVTGQGIYFRTDNNLLLRWWNGQVQILRPPTPFTVFPANGALYVMQERGRLMNVVEDSLVVIPGSKEVSVMEVPLLGLTTAPYDEASSFLAIDQSVWRFDGTTLLRYPTEADSFLHGRDTEGPFTALPGDRFAIGTRAGGVVLIDRQGRLLQVIGRDEGLQNNLLAMYVDRAGSLWLALDNGIARVDISSPLTRFDDASGLLTRRVYSIARHRGTLYVGNGNGGYWLDPATATFQPILNTSDQIWDLLGTDALVLRGRAFHVMKNRGSA